MQSWFPLLLAVGCGTPDITDVVELYPEITVSTDAIAFGDVGVPLTVEQDLTINNGGRADLHLQLALEGEGKAAYDLPVHDAVLAPDDRLKLALRFHPETFLAYPAELVLTSDDKETPELRLPISGTGVSAPLPDIDLSEGTVDFQEVDTATQHLVNVRNVGTAPLNVGDVRLEGSGAFTLLTSPGGTTIAPGNLFPMIVVYDPATTDGDSAQVVLSSDDPDEPETTLVLLGNGGADYAYPVAVIDCPGPVDPPRYVALNGLGSSDPLGFLPLSYEWRLVSVPTDPLGNVMSQGTLSSLAGETTTLFADAVGAYGVQLVVTNAIGTRSAPALCVVEAVPDEQLVVELTWDTERADLDLHVAQTGTTIYGGAGDASWCNLGPDWGAAAAGGDNPHLDLDDRAGFGPENISIDTPADGQYDLRVHYYDDHNDGTVAATLRVYVLNDTTPVFQATRLMHRDEVWDAARVNWPAATVAALSAANYPAPRRQCP